MFEHDKQISQVQKDQKDYIPTSSHEDYRFEQNINMYKNFASFFQQKSYKDPECVTKTCTTDLSYNNKSNSGKLTRKQDVSLIEKKKKPPVDQTNLLCYLSPKHHEDSAKLIMQRIRDSCEQLGNDSIISEPSKQVTTNASSGKFSFKGFEYYRPEEKKTRIEKRTIDQEEQNKFITPFKTKKQSADNSFTQKDHPKGQMDKAGAKSSRLGDNKREDEKQLNDKSKLMSANYQKELKKLKNQSEHYSNLLQVANKQRIESQTQIKSLNILINELKQKNASLTKSSQELSREILQLNTKMNMLSQEKEKLVQENSLINEEKNKLQEEVNYLKGTVKQLNDRIQLMFEAQKQIKLVQGQKSMNFIPSQPNHSRRLNSIIVGPNTAVQPRTQNIHEQSRLVHELRDQLKYCQVEISMLKRVKMDINKKNDEFIKLQKQNKALKNQLFDIKHSDFFDEPSLSREKGRSSSRIYNQTKPNQNIRKNFQIGLKREKMAADQRSDSLSSDTLSLNLSVSPEKNKHHSKIHRV